VRSLGVGAAGAGATGFGAGWPGATGTGVGIMVGIIDGPKGVVLHCLHQDDGNFTFCQLAQV